MKIAFHYKQKSFSCGPAALRMVIQTLIDHDVSEDVLIELIGSDEKIGTPLPIFETNLAPLLSKICDLYQIPNYFKFKIKQNSSIDELRILQDEGYVVLLNYTKPDGQPHWAVLNFVNNDVITLMDPDFGPNYQYALDKFNWQGGNKIKPTTKGLVAIKYSSS